MPSASKIKGSAWERQIADYLSKLYAEPFLRVPNSGAYTGGFNAKRKSTMQEQQIRNFKGDIIPGASFPLFNCEAKSYKDFPFHQLFSGQVKILEAWIDQCMEAADEGDFNIILFKINNKGKYAVVPAKYKCIRYDGIYYSSGNHGNWVVMDFDRFWNNNHMAVKLLCQKPLEKCS